MGEQSELAIHGGRPAVTCGPFVWPPADPEIHAALESAWRDGDWGRYFGSRCDRLRDALAEHHAVEHAHLCSSGTVAVELALRAVGVQAGDGVLLAGYDFSGNFRAIEALGATPVLVDIDPTTWSMDIENLAAHAEEAERLNIRAVVVSHLHGGLADMQALRELADQRGWRVVEDACQAAGATLQGRAVGAWGDVGVLSFGGSKLLTAGRGGALLTKDAAIAQRARVAAGRGNDAYPLSELQATVLLPQLERLAEKHATRERAARRLREAITKSTNSMAVVASREDASHAYFKVALALSQEKEQQTDASDRTKKVVAALKAEGAPFDEGFRGFAARSDRRCRRVGLLKVSEEYAHRTLILHHPCLLAGDRAVDQIAEAVVKVARNLELLGEA